MTPWLSALVNAVRSPQPADGYNLAIADRSILASFATVAELRFGAMKASWGEFRLRQLERSLGRFIIIDPDNEMLTTWAELRWTVRPG